MVKAGAGAVAIQIRHRHRHRCPLQNLSHQRHPSAPAVSDYVVASLTRYFSSTIVSDGHRTHLTAGVDLCSHANLAGKVADILRRYDSAAGLGLFSNHGPLYFVNTKTYFSKMGLSCHIAKIHSEASVNTNAKEIKDYIEEIYWGSNKRVMLLGHSKWGVDAAAALSLYWSDLKDKVAGLVLAQSPYGGSPIASDILREEQLGDYVKLRELMEILICKVIKGDLQALEDLTYVKRKEFLRKHPLPRELPVVSFHTEARIGPSVLATLSHVAHAELPIVTPLAEGQPTKLPVVIR